MASRFGFWTAAVMTNETLATADVFRMAQWISLHAASAMWSLVTVVWLFSYGRVFFFSVDEKLGLVFSLTITRSFLVEFLIILYRSIALQVHYLKSFELNWIQRRVQSLNPAEKAPIAILAPALCRVGFRDLAAQSFIRSSSADKQSCWVFKSLPIHNHFIQIKSTALAGFRILDGDRRDFAVVFVVLGWQVAIHRSTFECYGRLWGSSWLVGVAFDSVRHRGRGRKSWDVISPSYRQLFTPRSNHEIWFFVRVTRRPDHGPAAAHAHFHALHRPEIAHVLIRFELIKTPTFA